jgi:hypothetical protein
MKQETVAAVLYEPGVNLCGTGGFVQAVFSAINAYAYGSPASRVGEELANPAFAGYCIDAPIYVPAGSTRRQTDGHAVSSYATREAR